MSFSRRLVVPALLVASALGLAACAEGASEAPGAAEDGGLSIVTSTNVYGDIAATIAGDEVEVTAIVDSLSQDPHSYEATVQDKLSVSEADLVIENGGGYDPFLGRLAEETGVESVLNAVELSGLEGSEEHAEESEEHAEESAEGHAGEGHAHGAFNEHVWYSPPAMVALADAIAGELGRLDPAGADAYRERAGAFIAALQPVQDRLAALKADGPGGTVAVTEPVPAYLLEAAGLEDVTPEEFGEAIEEETDVPVAVLDEMTTLVAGGTLTFLAYNEQTEGPQTEAARSVAEDAGLPVLGFTETLPDGEDYVSWMTASTDSIEAALGS